MSTKGLPEDVRAFLQAHVESYEHLLIVLALRREPAREWSEAQLCSSLSIPAQTAGSALADLRAASLISSVPDRQPPLYRYAAAGTTDSTIARLAQEFSENPVEVVRFMTAGAIARVRTSALRTFADAFLLKKDKDG